VPSVPAAADAIGRRPGPLRITRRAFTGLALGAAGAGAWLLRREVHRDHDADDDDGPRGPSTVADARALPPYRAPEFLSGAASLSFLALGDMGWPGPARDAVVARMEHTASALPYSCVCLLGDNFYRSGTDGDGVRSIDDPRWQTGFEQVFSGSNLAVPFHALLGNHDHNGNAEAQVEYGARGTRWHMPGRYYSFALPAGTDCRAQFFVLDTEGIRREEREGVEQLRWLEQRLASSDARWKIALGHHPVRSNGVHGSIERVRGALEPLFERHGVALYLSGHDHDLELIETERGFLQVVSGAGSSTRDMRWGPDTRFASAAPGFVWVGIDRDELRLVFVDAGSGPVRCVGYELGKLVAGKLVGSASTG
jgi:tartrate-resistant acid phosphatase type 5